MKTLIRLTESDLHRIIRKCVNEAEDYTNAFKNFNASKKRYQQYRDTKDEKYHDSGYDLKRHGNDILNQELAGNYRYDTFGDKLKGKHSATFDIHYDPEGGAYGAINGYNKSGNKIFSTEKGSYTTSNGGYVTPRQFFRDKDIADAYSRANDVLWDYDNGKYNYDKDKGWYLNDED